MRISKRLIVSLISGAILGVACIIGVNVRSPEAQPRHLVAIWYNRVIIGLVIGLANKLVLVEGNVANRYLRGLVLGLLVSLAPFLSMEEIDVITFLAGGGYGLITEYAAHRWGQSD